MAIQIDIREGTDGMILHAAGDMDITTVDAFRDAAAELLDRGGRLRIDLSDLEFMDSTGINGLVDVIRSSEGRATVSDDLRPEVRRTLSITGIIRSLPMHPGADA
jgi:anti-sigma B factor antagonist